jgi:3-hydroxyisobutyrate dehydrogenase-like beta-hydroxyacid dehydrogenase
MAGLKVGFIGLGKMGRPMCMNLLKGGVDLTVCDASAAAMQVLENKGARAAKSPAELASRCDVVIIMVPGPKEVEEVCTGPDGIINGAKEGTIVVEMSTSLPSVSRRMCEAFSKRGVRMIDAPVSGMARGAIAGTLSIFVGGDAAVMETVRPVFEKMGTNIYHMGPVGSGQIMKVINNVLVSTCLATTGETMALAIKAGLKPKQVLDALTTSSGRNFGTNSIFADIILPGKPSDYTCAIMRKDIGVFLEVGKDLGVPTFIANLDHNLWSIPDGQQDATELFGIWEDWFKVKIRGNC